MQFWCSFPPTHKRFSSLLPCINLYEFNSLSIKTNFVKFEQAECSNSTFVEELSPPSRVFGTDSSFWQSIFFKGRDWEFKGEAHSLRAISTRRISSQNVQVNLLHWIQGWLLLMPPCSPWYMTGLQGRGEQQVHRSY